MKPRIGIPRLALGMTILVRRAPQNSLSALDQSDKRKHEFHPFNTLIRDHPGTAS
jgi:hypothetical protein